tara:strand:+ start:580 stop:1290 length:711 start_codon:yes stop_codon:yes gene_type:complete
MVDTTAFSGEVRERIGRGGARALRRSGRVPATIYGDNNENVSISVEMRELQRDLQRPGFTNRLCEVVVGSNKVRVLPREVQVDPVTDTPIHVDFMRISPRARVRLNVPVSFIDEEDSPGIKRGGVLNVVRHDIEFYCRADAIPESIVISLHGLDIGDSVHISSVTLPEGVKPTITDRDFTIATVAAPTIHVEEEPEEADLEGEEGEEGEGAEGAEAEGEGEAATAAAGNGGEEKGE